MKERPYIGVTGLAAAEEVRHLVASFKANGISRDTSHQPMAGFLVSQKTLNGQEVLSRRHPAVAKLPELLGESNFYTFNTIHYNSRQTTDLADQIKEIFVGQIYEDQLCRGIQLNIAWPPVEQLLEAKRALPDLSIIMQLSNKAINGKSPGEVAGLLRQYGGLIDYTLLDPSGGRGKPFQPQDIVPYYTALYDRLSHVTVGLAGGFTGENVSQRCKEIIDLVGSKEFSIDAEGGLRDKITDGFGDDTYNSDKVEDYLRVSKDALIG